MGEHLLTKLSSERSPADSHEAERLGEGVDDLVNHARVAALHGVVERVVAAVVLCRRITAEQQQQLHQWKVPEIPAIESRQQNS
jgi:hypothetical protein